MKSIITLGFLVLGIALLTPSCKKNHNATPSTKPDSLMFGEYNPWTETQIPSGKFFVLENNALYAYPITFPPVGNPTIKQQLSDSLYNIARYLIDNFPPYLIQHPKDSVIGSVANSGDRIIELCALSDTTMIRWQISSDTSSLPDELKQYIGQAEIIIYQL